MKKKTMFITIFCSIGTLVVGIIIGYLANALKTDFKNSVLTAGTFSIEPTATSSAVSLNVEEEYLAIWRNDGTPFAFGGVCSHAEIKDAHILKSGVLDKYVLSINFDYINSSDDSRNFINDTDCEVIAYQNGIALDTPGNTSEDGVYDYSDAFKGVKSGATISTQLAFVLEDTSHPIEIEFGTNEEYKPKFSKWIDIGNETSASGSAGLNNDTKTDKSADNFIAKGKTSLMNFLDASSKNGYEIIEPHHDGNYVTAKAKGLNGIFDIKYMVEDQHVYAVYVYTNNDNSSEEYQNCIASLAKALNPNADSESLNIAIVQTLVNKNERLIENEMLIKFDQDENCFVMTH